MTLYTIGHSTRSIDEFRDLLEAHQIGLLIDVRRYPGSRRHPHFNAEALAASLEARGIGYHHVPELGGRRGAPDLDSPNTGWRNTSFRAYADHLATPEFRRALESVIEAAGQRPVALMCAEAVPWRCHRQLIADALVARGHRVLHIASAAEPKPHELNEMAVCEGTGAITYPGPEPPQGELFSSRS